MLTKNRQQGLVFAASALLSLYVAHLVLVAPLVNSWQERSRRITALRRQVEGGERLVRKSREIRDDWDNVRTNTLPSNLPVAEQQMLKAVDSWAQQSRISVTAITPQRKQESEDFLSIVCRVDASGNIATVSRMLYEVEQARAFKLESFEISARDNAGQQLALGLQVSGLVLNPQTQ